MEEKNIFRILQEEKEQAYSNYHNSIKKNVEERKGVWYFLGDILDLYVPKIFSALIGNGSSPSGNSFNAIDPKEGKT